MQARFLKSIAIAVPLLLLCLGALTVPPEIFQRNYNTIFDLVNSRTTASIHKTIFVLGYYAPNDGGGGWFTLTNTTANTNIGTRFYSGNSGLSWERLQAPTVNVKAWGIRGDGVTDESARWQTMANYINSLPNGTTLVVPQGDYLASGIVFTQRNLSITGVGMPRIKPILAHNANQFAFMAPVVGRIEGVLFDGRQNEYATTNEWLITLHIASENVIIENCIFTNWNRSAVMANFFATNEFLHVRNCEFWNGRAYGIQGADNNLARLTSFAVTLNNGGTVDTLSTAFVEKNLFQQTQVAAPDMKFPAAFIASGHILPVARGSRVRAIFNDNKVINLVGPVGYDSVTQIEFKNNYISNYTYAAIVSENADNSVIDNNVVYMSTHAMADISGGTGAGIFVAPEIRGDTDWAKSIKVTNNRIYGNGDTRDTIGIWVQGYNATDRLAEDILVEGNRVEYVRTAIKFLYTGRDIVSRNNVIIATNTTTTGAIDIQNAMGTVTVDSDTIYATNTHAIYMFSGVANGSLRLISPQIWTSGSSYCLAVGGMSNLVVNGGSFYNSSGTAPILVSSGVHSFHLSPDTILSGLPIITSTTTNISGRIVIPSSPEGTYRGIKGAKAFVNSTVAGVNPEWVKTTDSTVNTGWIQVASSGSGVTSVAGTANEIEVSPSTGNVIVGLPNTPIITTSLGIGGVPGGNIPLYVFGTNDALRQARFFLAGPGASSVGQIYLLNDTSDSVGMEIFGSTHVPFARQTRFTASSTMRFYSGGVERLQLNTTGGTLTGNLLVNDEAYGAPWDTSLAVPTKNATYDKIEALTTALNASIATKLDKTGLPMMWFAASDETTPLTAGIKLVIRAPRAFTITGIRGGLTTASTAPGDSSVIVNLLHGAATDVIRFDATEKTTLTAAIAPSNLVPAVTDDQEFTVNITTPGTGATGLKLIVYGTPP